MVGTTLFPFYWMVITSVRPDVELYNVKMNPFFTLHPTLDHFYYLFELTMFPLWAWNTVFIAVVSTGISLFCGLLAGYALARLQFRWAPSLGTVIFITWMARALQGLRTLPLCHAPAARRTKGAQAGKRLGTRAQRVSYLRS